MFSNRSEPKFGGECEGRQMIHYYSSGIGSKKGAVSGCDGSIRDGLSGSSRIVKGSILSIRGLPLFSIDPEFFETACKKDPAKIIHQLPNFYSRFSLT
jgi:hypothetical protein